MHSKYLRAVQFKFVEEQTRVALETVTIIDRVITTYARNVVKKGFMEFLSVLIVWPTVFENSMEQLKDNGKITNRGIKIFRGEEFHADVSSSC